MPEPDAPSDEVERLRAELEAARRTIDALTSRVEALDGNAPEEAGAMARALAGMQRELARRTRTLEETEATYRALYESTPDPLLTVDSAGTVLACNRTGLEWLALPVDHVVGQSLASLFHDREGPVLERMVEVGWTGVTERRFTLRGGRRISLNALRIHGTTPARFHLTIRDVTTREVIEEAEDQRRRMEALFELAQDVTRDLNDPMSIVEGRLELLQIGDLGPEDMDRHLEVALRHARRISVTLRNLGMVGRTSVSHLRRVFLTDALDEATGMLGSRLDKTELERDIAPAELAVGGIRPLYARVLHNLLDRLLDHCGPDGRLVVRARLRGDEVVLWLLGGAHLPATTELVPPPAGDEGHLEQEVGLGVTLARTLVASMGGRLEARSSGQRAMYELHLPMAPFARARARPVEHRVLVVGSDDLLASIDTLLHREGFGLEHERDAEAALERLDVDADLSGVVTELLLPGLSGLSLVYEIDRLHPRVHNRVVLVSETKLVSAPHTVTVLLVPLRRSALLSALGRRSRRR